MLKEYRKTSHGYEYWDTEAKRIITLKKRIDEQQIEAVDQDENKPSFSEAEVMNFDTMSVKELKAFAEQHGIDIPKSMTKKELVIERITGESND